MFKEFAASEDNPKWADLIRREKALYTRERDPRSEFNRDYNRLLHCRAYRRLKHKTQVFFAPDNDHICTRIEHVNHVVSISRTIAEKLELNIDLTDAIAIGHDLGHTPFGHEGEEIIREITENELGETFWHEKNSLWFVDNIETLANEDNKQENLSLTYGVRDGIICHCGEVDDSEIKPREEVIENLYDLKTPSQVSPFSWEGCVVKVADKIAFYGRDLEDAISLGLMPAARFYRHIIKKLYKLGRKERIRDKLHSQSKEIINNTTLIHSFVLDLLDNSNPEKGLTFSPWYQDFLKALREVSGNLIYEHPRLDSSKKLIRLVIGEIFDKLMKLENVDLSIQRIEDGLEHYPVLKDAFLEWMIQYSNISKHRKKISGFDNKTIYDIRDRGQYVRGVIDFISGMTDRFAFSVFEEFTRFK